LPQLVVSQNTVVSCMSTQLGVLAHPLTRASPRGRAAIVNPTSQQADPISPRLSSSGDLLKPAHGQRRLEYTCSTFSTVAACTAAELSARAAAAAVAAAVVAAAWSTRS
jgi:hypothetical protein